MTSKRLALVLLSASVALSAPVWAADPNSEQIYEAARTGHLAQAQQMVEQVLRDHPNNAKAHYVAAEVYAREGNFAVARSQLQQAETIDPAGTYASATSIQELKSELASGGRATSGTTGTYVVPERARESHFPLLGIVIAIAAIGLLWMVFRRRSMPGYAAGGYGNGMPAAPRPFGPGGGYAPGYGPGYGAPPAGGGIGSSVAGGLASGLAVGAGVVAGEELAHHFLDGNEHREVGAAPPEEPPQNSDMGGNDFGVNDPGSWDDSGSGGDGGGGGGDDWT